MISSMVRSISLMLEFPLKISKIIKFPSDSLYTANIGRIPILQYNTHRRFCQYRQRPPTAVLTIPCRKIQKCVIKRAFPTCPSNTVEKCKQNVKSQIRPWQNKISVVELRWQLKTTKCIEQKQVAPASVQRETAVGASSWRKLRWIHSASSVLNPRISRESRLRRCRPLQR